MTLELASLVTFVLIHRQIQALPGLKVNLRWPSTTTLHSGRILEFLKEVVPTQVNLYAIRIGLPSKTDVTNAQIVTVSLLWTRHRVRPVGASRAGTPWFLRASQASGREVPRPGAMTQRGRINLCWDPEKGSISCGYCWLGEGSQRVFSMNTLLELGPGGLDLPKWQ